MKIGIIVVSAILAAGVLAIAVAESFPLMAYDHVLTKKNTPLVFQELKDGHLICCGIFSCKGTTKMKVDYISEMADPSIFFKYRMACDDYRYYVLIPRFSALTDSLDKIISGEDIY